jgi:hypothetical protein
LQRVGILELVEQQMFPARIQFHQHGGGGFLVIEQTQGFQFAVVEVERAAFGFQILIGLQVDRACRSGRGGSGATRAGRCSGQHALQPVRPDR